MSDGSYPPPPDRPAERVTLGSVRLLVDAAEVPVVVRFAAVTVVVQAPEETWITLGLIAASDPEYLTVSGGRIYLGDDQAGDEVVYRVVGWDMEHEALRVVRDRS